MRLLSRIARVVASLNGGSDIGPRHRLNFSGAGVSSITDDPTNDEIDIVISGGGGGSVPTGTGFEHVTAGVEDAAAKLVVNADVDAAAAIARTKLANMTSARLLGRTTAGAGADEEISVGNGLTFGATALSAISATAATAQVATAETTASTTYVDLATAGPSVTITIGPSGLALVLWSVKNSCTTNGVIFDSLSVDGATPVDADAARFVSATALQITSTQIMLVTGLSAASHTFKIQYRVTAGTGTFLDRRLVVIPL